MQSWVRSSGRQGLYLLPGNQQTKTAQTALKALGKPISAIRQSVSRFFRDGLHYILFDTAPSVGFIQERAIWASDLVIVPTAAEFRSTDGVSAALLMMSLLQERKNWRGNVLGILPTFFDEQSCEGRAVMENLKERFDGSVLAPIHRSTLLRECAAEGKTIFEFDPLCRAAKEYQALAQHVMRF